MILILIFRYQGRNSIFLKRIDVKIIFKETRVAQEVYY